MEADRSEPVGGVPRLDSNPGPTSGAAVPEHVRDPPLQVLVAGHDEEGVREAVQVLHDEAADGLLARQPDGQALRPPASRPPRRQTVLATWSCAAPDEPPGRMKLSRYGSSSESSSISRSRAST